MSGVAAVDREHEAVELHQPSHDRFLWPAWRFGWVVAPPRKPVTVRQAQEVGAFFEEAEEESARLYEERLKSLDSFFTGRGGKLLYGRDLAGQPDLPSWLASQDKRTPSVRHFIVPVVRFRNFVVRLGQASWLFREGITVCGHPSRSKLWLGASLIAWNHGGTLDKGVDSATLEVAREEIGTVYRHTLDTLKTFYSGILKGDLVDSPHWAPLLEEDEELEPIARIEAVGLGTPVNLTDLYDRMEEVGLEKALDETSEHRPDSPNGVVSMFLSLLSSFASKGLTEHPPKMLDIYSEKNPYQEPLRALVITRSSTEERITHYTGLITQTDSCSDSLKDILSEKVARFIAQEFGRCY